MFVKLATGRLYFMKFLKLDKHYISETDLFLAELRQKFLLPSASQQAEIEKHRRIAELRDEKQ